MTSKILMIITLISLAQTHSLVCMKKRERVTHLKESKEPSKKAHYAAPNGNGLIKKHAKAQRAPSLHVAGRLSIDQIQQMLNQGADVHEVQNGETPLYRFIEARNPHGIEKLLLYGALVTHKDNYGETPLHLAGRNNAHLATILITSPQGNPARATEEMHAWCQGNAFSYWLLKNHFKVPKDVCLIICKYMIPSLKKLVTMIPLHSLPLYLDRYSLDEKKAALDFLVKRHIADLFFHLDVKNHRKKTPQEVAISYGHRMLPFVPPVTVFNKALISQHKPTIVANYAKLLGISSN